MNEGFAKALRRQSRAQGHQTTAPGRGTVIPGRNAKALWKSLTHKERGQWRSKLPITRAKRQRQARTFAEAVAAGATFRVRIPEGLRW